MPLDEGLLREARGARDRLTHREYEAELARVSFQHAIRKLHGAGASLREIGDALGLSYQRVHQIVDVGTGKGSIKDSRIDQACSFCGTAGRDTRKLIAGPGVFVCDACVGLAHEVLVGQKERANHLTRLVPVDPEARGVRCRFCGKRRAAVSMAEAPDRLLGGKFARRPDAPRVCAECLVLCMEILAEDAEV